MSNLPRVRDLAAGITARFVAAGATRVEPPVLQSAERLLDLYGEDIRAHAYVTQDPIHGELLLRPDFTVPVADEYLRGPRTTMRYTYAGEVFRRPEHDEDARANFQVGYELFDRAPRAEGDVEVFATIVDALPKAAYQIVCGDIGVLIAAVRGLSCAPARKAALLRHLWRPRRFKALLNTFGRKTCPDLPDRNATLVGKRTWEDIEARVRALQADAAEPPIDGDEVSLLDDLLDLRVPLVDAADVLARLSQDYPPLWDAVVKVQTRTKALAAVMDISDIVFEGSYGRTAMEYYDGFVFGVMLGGETVATGGRYDMLTTILGKGNGIPAVGGIVRPDLLIKAGVA